MKRIELNCFGIVVELDEKGSGIITSNLHEAPTEEECKEIDVEAFEEVVEYNHFMDGIEALILSLACAGVDITTPAFLEGIESAVMGCVNH